MSRVTNSELCNALGGAYVRFPRTAHFWPIMTRPWRRHPEIKMDVTLMVIKLLIVAACCAPSVLIAQTPANAAGVVDQVNSAAKRHDFNALRRLMTDEFKWTLGPSSETAGEAIAAWTRERRTLQELVAATSQGCEVLERTLIQCPAGAGRGFRAGFSQVDGTWKMRYFLAGD